MTWTEFCPLQERFRTKLAEKLVEHDENQVTSSVDPSRIVFVNVHAHCNTFAVDNKNAEVEFYVKGKENNEVDIKLTNKAFEILENYVNNGKLSELDSAFDGKVRI